MKLKQIVFWFYKPAIDGEVIDNGIDIWTGILAVARLDITALKYRYSHVEVEFVDRQLCYSATLRDAAKGVRFASTSAVLRHPERWDGISVYVTANTEAKMFSAAVKEKGKLYDKWGLFTGFFLLAWYLQNDIKRYCSDLVAWIALIGGLLKKRYWIISPRRLAKILAKKYGEPKSHKEVRLQRAWDDMHMEAE